MTLTLSHGPLAGKPADRNYHIEGPPHRLFFEDFPRRVRALFGGETVFDTRRGKLLHETGLLPQLYIPREDVRFDRLEETEHSTHCPFKGDAAYWSVRAGHRVAQNAVWAYPQPREGAPWLRDYVAFYWKSMDTWFDEDEEVQGHLRDPYHRVDVRETSRHVRIVADGEVVAETDRPKILSETGLPNRFYIPPEDVRRGLLQPSATYTICPYKGTASYRTLKIGDRRIEDAVWFYPEPWRMPLRSVITSALWPKASRPRSTERASSERKTCPWACHAAADGQYSHPGAQRHSALELTPQACREGA